MAEDNKIRLQGFGGLVRYDEEYQSKFMISPAQVIGYVIAVIIGVVALKVFWPIA